MFFCRTARRLLPRALALALALPVAPAGAAPSSLRWTKRHLLTSPHENAAVADLDKDGHLDIVSGSFVFDGPHFAPRAYRPNHLAADYIHENSVHLMDVDGDGWLDILVGGWGEDGLYWHKNPGNSFKEQRKEWEMHQPWKAHLLAKTRGTMEMFALHDYDGDGVPELHAANYRRQNPLEVFRFTKAGGAITMTPFVLGREGGGHGLAFGDVNGDGREDVLCEIGWYERPAGDPWTGPWKLHAETDLTKMHPSCPFVVKDLNRDGRLDIIFGRGHAYGLYWREQLPPAADGTTQWRQHTIDETWSQAHCLVLADLDGDREEDLIAGKCLWAHNGGDPGAADPPGVYYYTWNRAAMKWTRHTITEPAEGIAINRQFAVADLNNDGRPDIVAPSKRALWVLFNEGAK